MFMKASKARTLARGEYMKLHANCMNSGVNDASKAGLIDPQRIRACGFHLMSCLMLGVIGALFVLIG